MPKQGDFAGGWLPIESAPKDGTRILGKQGGSSSEIFWSMAFGDWVFAEVFERGLDRGAWDLCGSLHPFTAWKPKP